LFRQQQKRFYRIIKIIVKIIAEVRILDIEIIKEKALKLSEAVGTENVIDIFDREMDASELSASDYMVITRLADVYHQVRCGHIRRDEGVLKQRELISEWRKECI
jgi:hypothetical protein